MDVIDDRVTVAELIATVKEVIVAANLSATQPGRDLRVASIEITLHTLATRTAGGVADFRIPVLGLQVKLGRTISRTDLHTLTITLRPPAPARTVELRGPALDEILVEAIERVRTAVATAAQGDDPFELGESTIDITFGITQEGSITLGFEGNLTDDVSHTLKLRLVPA
ncbi:trypco2 family protein [Winogradskya humida]|uniref:Trypsin-co-occurring domain-containing protein n=1 Tax=Winogradskya humida TaxID=113566 RepID=A0ABQ3ZTY5_9ACTN|nr:trypco2 family protein [Actinoplanes humidus]GIE22046.1 hypothetical protein Ahu01nite_051480 [Actinoplanes humidus]